MYDIMLVASTKFIGIKSKFQDGATIELEAKQDHLGKYFSVDAFASFEETIKFCAAKTKQECHVNTYFSASRRNTEKFAKANNSAEIEEKYHFR